MDRTDDDPTNALAVGFDFTFNLGSLLYHKNEADNLLQYADAYDRPIAQQYLSGMTAFSVGARLGLVKKASTKP